MKSICVIPARYASTRFPGKPLALIAGKPMIQRVYERAKAAELIDHVIVATDNEKIRAVVESFGGQAVMTDPSLPSGTDRVAAAINNEDVDVVVNLQGDEPLISSRLLSSLVKVFANSEIRMATPVKRIKTIEDLTDPNLVRVALDVNHYAMYFTRSVIPYLRDVNKREEWFKKFKYFKHIGIYAYRKSFLQQITRLPESSLEKAERLEQLRVLENGFKIYTVETDYESMSVDTPDDLRKINELLTNNKIKFE
ncbi:MAG: 3-deoxy-manno-octulosonate cytidylyltransferase [Calditrichales bacterium]|nr:3-deoxy-manno-octulosonate cytidylyltransferase [Calditrichales bacterium]